jgi:hypothetical protein
MSGFADWIGAQADGDEPGEAPSEREVVETQAETPLPSGSSPDDPLWQGLAAHNFPAQPGLDEERLQDDPSDRNPDLWMYRGRTVGLLRRYMRFSIETGRLPSVIGREFFRAKVTAYTATTFEDRVIFVRDVEKSLDRLEYWDQQLIARIILQEYNQEQAARILHWGLRSVERRLPQVLDLLSEDFLRVGLLAAQPSKRGVSR